MLHARLAAPGAGAPYGLGAVRFLVWAVGVFWERITAYDPPRSFEYHVYRSFPPARHELGRVEFTDTADGTEVVWTTVVELRFPVIGALLTRWVVRPLFTHAFAWVLDAATRELTAPVS